MEDINNEDINKLLDKITIANVNKQISDGLQSSFFMAEYIVGLDVWKSLSRDDQRILAARVHRIIRENRLL